MTIKFRCGYCHKQLSAPETAGGKQGKCPHCKQSTYIPSPVSDDDVLDLAPIDEEDEARQKRMEEELFRQEHDLLAESGGAAGGQPPLEQRKDLTAEDLYHFVVNYCLDIASGKLEKATKTKGDLKKYGSVAMQAVSDFQIGKALEPALDSIPVPVLQGFLSELMTELRNG